MPQIMISAGEVSGDLHGSYLMRELREKQPEIEFMGLGGDRMQALGMELFHHVREMSIIGFFEVLKKLPFIRRVFREMEQAFSTRRPDLLILIDYPGFNLRLARLAKKYDIPVVYYICPQVWAWGYKRVYKIARYVDKALVIFPFEEAMINNVGGNAFYVGHPLLDFLKSRFSKKEFQEHFKIQMKERVIGLVPGSRVAEVIGLLPEMLRTTVELRKRLPGLRVVIVKAESVPQHCYDEILAEGYADVAVEEALTYDIMQHSDVLMVASGTATLEAALFGTPLLLCYCTSPITYAIAKRVARIEFIGLPNIILGHAVVPEFIQNAVQAERMAPVLEQYLTDESINREVRGDLKSLRKKMGQPGAARRAAEQILKLLPVDEAHG